MAEYLLDITAPAACDQLQPIRQQLRTVLQTLPASVQQQADIVLAVDEALQNVIRHGYGGNSTQPMQVRLELQTRWLWLHILDDAPRVDGSVCQPRALPEQIEDLRPGGLGTHIMQTIMHRLDYLPSPTGGNHLRMGIQLDEGNN